MAMGWLPIESAPHADFTWLVTARFADNKLLWWERATWRPKWNQWRSDRGGVVEPTHYLPLPSAPAVVVAEGKKPPSEMALQIAKRNKETIETVGALRLANDVDAELAEAREVLDVFLTDPAHNLDCPTQREANAGCDCHIQRARALYDKLKID